MARRLRGEPWSDISLRISGAVVVDSLKVMYAPTPKAACTTLKRLLAEAAGTYDEGALLKMTAPDHTPEQAIHHPLVNGFVYFRNLRDDEQRAILDSPDWWRVGAARNPYARVYSAFENNVLVSGGTMRDGIRSRYREIIEADRLDLTATFELFIKILADNRAAFFEDDHLRPQIWQVSPEVINYTHFFKVETPGAVDGFARELSARASREVTPRRLNEGLGLSYRDVMTAETARLVEEIYQPDFEHLGYDRESFPDSIEHRLLSLQETRLVHLAQRMWLRQWQMSVAALSLQGFRYGAKQMGSRVRQALGFGRPEPGLDH